MLSALARLLATVLSRTDCADNPEPAMSNTLKEGMRFPRGSLACDRRHQVAELGVQEGQSRLKVHRVLRELRLLHLHVDGVAVEGGSERYAILQVGGLSAGIRGSRHVSRV